MKNDATRLLISLAMLTLLLAPLAGGGPSRASRKGEAMDEEQDGAQNELAEALKEAGINPEEPGAHYLLATDPGAQRALKLMLEGTGPQQSEKDTPPQSLTVGSLSICAVADPTSWQDTRGESARWLDITFDGGDWDAVFRDALAAPDSGSSYTMLRRIEGMYEDVIYKADEVERLREECLRLKAVTSNVRALEGLRKLILACDEALKLSMGLFMASD